MTTSADQSQSFIVPAAATAEADRLGHTVVDTDHVLVGLMAAGGPAAMTLVDHGLTLAGLRAVMVELQRDDVAGLLDADTRTDPAVVGVAPHALLDTAGDPARLAAWYGASTVADTTRDDDSLRLELVDDHGSISTLTVVARARGAGSHVDLTLDDPTDHRDGRLVGRLLRWVRTSHLRSAVTSLAAAC